MRVLEQLYLIQRVQPWFRNELSRLASQDTEASLHRFRIVDCNAWTAMRGYSQSRLRADRTLFGPLLESFVFSELLKLSAWTEDRVMLFHYRDRDQVEVYFVLENSAGEIVGIEVKSAASVTRRDFLGLERVGSAAGSAFKQGIVLYDGVQTLSFADNLRAVPLSALWA